MMFPGFFHIPAQRHSTLSEQDSPSSEEAGPLQREGEGGSLLDQVYSFCAKKKIMFLAVVGSNIPTLFASFFFSHALKVAVKVYFFGNILINSIKAAARQLRFSVCSLWAVHQSIFFSIFPKFWCPDFFFR